MKKFNLKLNNVKKREITYFSSEEKLQWLKLLEDDRTHFRKMVLKQILKMWDKDMKFFPPNLCKNKVVLDAGCGNLRYTSYLKQLGAKICVGFDISKYFMKNGLIKSKVYVYDSCVKVCDTCVQGDCEVMPFKPKTFDTIVFFHSLHHIPNKSNALEESFRALKDSGYLIICDLNGSHPLRNVANIIGKKYGPMSKDERALKHSEIVKLLEANKFDIIRIYYMNIFSEPFFHLANIASRRFFSMSFLLNFLLFILNPIDDIGDKTLLRVIPRLAWRYMIIAKKKI
jgi:SAM-dependent methyltransferase